MTEVNSCTCTHGRARHSVVLCEYLDKDNKKRRGYVCQIATCPCYNFVPTKKDNAKPIIFAAQTGRIKSDRPNRANAAKARA